MRTNDPQSESTSMRLKNPSLRTALGAMLTGALVLPLVTLGVAAPASADALAVTAGQVSWGVDPVNYATIFTTRTNTASGRRGMGPSAAYASERRSSTNRGASSARAPLTASAHSRVSGARPGSETPAPSR